MVSSTENLKKINASQIQFQYWSQICTKTLRLLRNLNIIKETLPLIQETTQKSSKYLNILLFNVCDENEDDLSSRISLYSSQKYSKILLNLYTFLSSLMYIYTFLNILFGVSIYKSTDQSMLTNGLLHIGRAKDTKCFCPRWGSNSQPPHLLDSILSYKYSALTDCATGARLLFNFIHHRFILY